MKAKLFSLLPGVRWDPHDLPTDDPSSSTTPKHKTRPTARFGLKPSTSSPPPQIHFRVREALLPPSDSAIAASAHPRTRAQVQSPFFSRLPLELRVMVYEFVVGASTLHLSLSTKKRRYGHFVCETAHHANGTSADAGCECRMVDGRAKRRLDCAAAGLLRVCRRMHTESLPTLYTPHTLSLLHITHLLYLPSQHKTMLTYLRTLRLRWAIRALPYLRRGPANRIVYREDTANWERCWDILAGMRALRDLWVELVDPSPRATWETAWGQLEGVLVQGMRSVRTVRNAVVILPYDSCRTDWDMGEGSVRLMRPGEGGVQPKY